MHLEQKIASWDGKSAADIQAIYDAHSAETHFSETIIALFRSGTLQKGATWLLKAWLEAGNTLAKHQIANIYQTLDQLENWEAKLHVLQCIPYLSIPDTEKSNVYSFLKKTITDPNKFVRVWSYNGYYEISKQHPEYERETKRSFEIAMLDEAPSVKARIRNIMKKGF